MNTFIPTRRPEQIVFDIEQRFITEDVTAQRVVATKILLTNQGQDVVFINDIAILSGESLKVDIEAPHLIDFQFSIRFVPATVVVAGDGIVSGKKVLLTTMKPK